MKPNPRTASISVLHLSIERPKTKSIASATYKSTRNSSMLAFQFGPELTEKPQTNPQLTLQLKPPLPKTNELKANTLTTHRKN